ncbi:ACP S-malonyltransferase [Chlamydiota bacterium]
MSVYVFPGQGSQKKGMGQELFDAYPDLVKKADEILGYSIKELCLEDPNNQLGQTQFTQPALFVVNALTYLKKLADGVEKPAYVAGHSLGEYNALFASEVFDFETGLQIVKKRGAIMAEAKNGGMAAVIGLTEESIASVLKESGLDSLDIANMNSPSQIVISGLKDDIGKAKEIFEKAGARMYIPLQVSGAFHSRYMKESMETFETFIKEFSFSDQKIPVIANVTARPYGKGDIPKLMVEQITSSVKWCESIRYLMGVGESVFDEVGPGTVLTGLIRKIQSEATPLVVKNESEKKEPIKKDETKHGKKTNKDLDTEVIMRNDAKKKTDEENIMPKKKVVKDEAKETKKKVPIEEKKKVIPDQKQSNNGTKITAESLGSLAFKKDYNLKYAYLTGAMVRGIASKEIVAKMGKAGMMGFLGTGGMNLDEIEDGIKYIQAELTDGQAYGMNILCNIIEPEMEEKTVDLYLQCGITTVEAAAYMQLTPAIVRYRILGLEKGSDGTVIAKNRIIAKVSRPEVAEIFLAPANERIVKKLLEEEKITQDQADMAKKIAMADDICVEADSGGHTDMGVASALMPAMIKLRDEKMKEFGYKKNIRIGAAGGIGTPEAAAAAFVLGADFIVTGSINQCTVESGASGVMKDLLQQCNVQDTEYAPAGDMFEMGAKVQVLKKGLFFPARANKLYDLYRFCNSLEEIDEKTRTQIQEKYFKKTFDEVYEETKAYFMKRQPEEVEKAERNPKHKMALVFRWYFGHTMRLAMNGSDQQKVDYQIHCGPALGAFNQWVKGTQLEEWQNRHVDEIAKKLIIETADILNKRFELLSTQ